MGVEQGPNQGWDAGYHRLLGDLMMSPSWDQAPLQMGRLRHEVRKDELKASGWLPQHELPPGGGGVLPSGGGAAWRQSQGSGS